MERRRKQNIVPAVFAAVLLLGSLVRFLALGSFPPGLNQDEASEGYEAWALLCSGMDRNGNSFPALFVSWGSGQNVLYAWLSMPFIALFGLNPVSLRLAAAVIGTLTLPVMYCLGKRLGGTYTGVAALVLTAFCPWHIMLSRWALEANILPFFLMAGILLGVVSAEKPWALCGAAAMLALSLYAYGTAFIFLAVYLPPALISLAVKGKIPWKIWLVSGCVFLLIALPVTVTNLINILDLEQITFLGITLPKLNEARQTSTTAFGKDFGAYWQNAKKFLEILIKQTDGYPYNAVPGKMFAPGTLLLAAAGLSETLYRTVRKRLCPGEMLMLWTVPAVIASVFVIDPNLNRVNMAFLPVLYYGARGVGFLAEKIPWKAGKGILCLLGAVSVLFGLWSAGKRYVTEIRDTLSYWFFDGVGEAIEYADSMDADTVWVTDSVNMPYIYVLFYTETPPEEFLHTVEYRNPGAAFQWVDAFGKWRFGSEPQPDENAVYVLYTWEAEGKEILARYGDFVVCRE